MAVALVRISNLGFAVLFLLIVAAALYVRVVRQDLRPLHNDEGVNHFFIEQVQRDGYYSYSHENYHGPLYFYLTYAAVELWGDGELALRASAIIMSVATIFLLLLLGRSEGRLFVLLAAALLACSSSLVFYGRYAIHESLFNFGGLLTASAAYLWWRSAQVRYWYLIALGLGILIATKETFIISLFCLFCAFWALGRPREKLRQIYEQRLHVCGGWVLLVFFTVLVYSGAFQWYGGLRELFLAVPQWIGRNQSDVGHFKPFLYYVHMLIHPATADWLNQLPGLNFGRWLQSTRGTEPYLILVLLLPLLAVMVNPAAARAAVFSADYAWPRFTFVWGALSFLVYSGVSYKTPWLVINITLPFLLLLAWLLARLPAAGREWRLSGAVIGAAVLGVAGWYCYYFNFARPYGSGNPYSYVHSSPGMLDLVADIARYREKHPQARILVGTKGYWPLPYYLRGMKGQLGYLHANSPADYSDAYDILIVDHTVKWQDPGWLKRYYRLTDAQESFTFFRRQE